MSRATRPVVTRFPEHELVIERLARTGESFRAMCEEYADGVDALSRWRRAGRPGAEVDELRDSLAELEEEILQAIRERAMPGARRRFGEQGR